MPRPTIRDVAKKANVGIGTVSRVLNNSPQVTPSTRERVLTAISELGFRPDQAARQLPRKTRLHNIGVITLPFFHYYSFVERLRGVQTALDAEQEAYELTLYNVSSREDIDARLKAIVTSGTIEGLLIIDLMPSEAQRTFLSHQHIPYVGINNFETDEWPCVGIGNRQGGKLATDYLLSLGHTNIAYLGDDFPDPYGFPTSAERYEGYEQALEAQGIEVNPDNVQLGAHGYESAQHLAEQFLQNEVMPTAIFAMSDIQALGAMTAIRNAGLRVPEDISVIGYDNLELSYHTGLTTVNQHLELSGRRSMEYLLQFLNGEAGQSPELPPLEVIPRQTTAPFH